MVELEEASAGCAAVILGRRDSRVCSASAHRRHREEGLYPARAGGGSRPPRGLGHQDRYPGSSGPRGRWAWGSWSPSAPDVPFGAMSCLSSLCGQVGQVSYKPAPPAAGSACSTHGELSSRESGLLTRRTRESLLPRTRAAHPTQGSSNLTTF